jgi:hypothetical protein
MVKGALIQTAMVVVLLRRAKRAQIFRFAQDDKRGSTPKPPKGGFNTSSRGGRAVAAC